MKKILSALMFAIFARQVFTIIMKIILITGCSILIKVITVICMCRALMCRNIIRHIIKLVTNLSTSLKFQEQMKKSGVMIQKDIIGTRKKLFI